LELDTESRGDTSKVLKANRTIPLRLVSLHLLFSHPKLSFQF